MKHIRDIEEVSFESVEDLKDFMMKGKGTAMYYNGYMGEYTPISIDESTGNLIIGFDAWSEIEEHHIDKVYGFITK